MPAPRTAAAAGLAALVLLVCSCSSGDAPPRPRGVLLISIDSLRPDHLSCYGYESATAPGVATSPVIDRELAGAGVLFERAVSTTSWTLPSHMALLTGLPDELHGVRHATHRLHPARPLLSEILSGAGWRTGGFFSGPNVHPHFGFGRGFERYVDCSTKTVDDPSIFSVDQSTSDVQAMKDLQRLSHQGVTSPKLVEAFDEWFGTVGESERFFAFVHMWDVHYDYAAPAEYLELFDPDYDGWVDGENFWDLDAPPDEHGVRPEPAERDVLHLKALYDAEIRYTDHHIGLMLARLREAGRLDDTLVVLVSDHGEEFFEHGRFGHDRTLYEEVVRVPLILRYPPLLTAGARLDDLVSLTDVAPTILELVDVARPPGFWGRSLLPALAGELPPRAAPMELTFRRPDNFLSGYHGGDFKVTRFSRSKDPVVHDLVRDPGERVELRVGPRAEGGLDREDPRLVAARRLWGELSRVAGLLERLDSGDLPPDLADQLRRIGYTTGTEDE